MLPTVFRFRYGNGGSPDVQTYPSDPIGEDGVPHPVSTELTNLVPVTTYTFSVIATNLNGSTLGPEQTFTTPDFPAIGGCLGPLGDCRCSDPNGNDPARLQRHHHPLRVRTHGRLRLEHAR